MEIILDNSESKDVGSHSGKGVRRDSVIDEKVSADIWVDNLVPIVSRGNVHNVYLCSSISEPIEYCKLIEFLGMVEEDDTVYLRLNNGGGNVDSGMMICNAIKECNGRTIADIQGMVASISTFIALAADEIIVGDHANFMVHNYSHGTSGTGSQVKEYVNFIDEELGKTFKIVYDGFLTKAEMATVLKHDKEIWMGKDELVGRLEKIGKIKKSDSVDGSVGGVR